jgi:hypothetical protein
MVSADHPDLSYSVAIPDMLIAQLSQVRPFELPTREQMLWAIRASVSDGVAGVTGAHRELLLREFRPDLYVTGRYHLRSGRLRVILEAYRGSERLFTRMFEESEEEFFDLIDKAVAGLLRELRTAEPGPWASLSGAAPSQAAGDPFAARAQDGRRRWVYAVQGALERLPDRELAEELEGQLMGSELDVAALQALNDTLRSSEEFVQVRAVCSTHGPVDASGTACRDCGTGLRFVLNPERAGGKK